MNVIIITKNMAIDCRLEFGLHSNVFPQKIFINQNEKSYVLTQKPHVKSLQERVWKFLKIWTVVN